MAVGSKGGAKIFFFDIPSGQLSRTVVLGIPDVGAYFNIVGMEYLPESLEFFGFGQTKSRNFSLAFLRRFSRLKDLYLECHTKNIEAVSTLSHLERLTLRSITHGTGTYTMEIGEYAEVPFDLAKKIIEQSKKEHEEAHG